MILPGSIIHTDGWKAYNNIPTLSGGYIHILFNDSIKFFNPQTGAPTQTVEKVCREEKKFTACMKMYKGMMYLFIFLSTFGEMRNL